MVWGYLGYVIFLGCFVVRCLCALFIGFCGGVYELFGCVICRVSAGVCRLFYFGVGFSGLICSGLLCLM